MTKTGNRRRGSGDRKRKRLLRRLANSVLHLRGEGKRAGDGGRARDTPGRGSQGQAGRQRPGSDAPAIRSRTSGGSQCGGICLLLRTGGQRRGSNRKGGRGRLAARARERNKNGGTNTRAG